MSISDNARKIPGVAAAEGAVTGALATEQDLPIAGYDEHTAEEIASRLRGFTQRELRTIDAYERKRGNRATITDRVAKLLGEQPWAGYDEQSVEPSRASSTRSTARPPAWSSATSASTRTAPESSRPPRGATTAAQSPQLLFRSDSNEQRSEEGRAVPRRGACHRAGARPRAAVADRDDAARVIPLRPGDAPRRDARARRSGR